MLASLSFGCSSKVHLGGAEFVTLSTPIRTDQHCLCVLSGPISSVYAIPDPYDPPLSDKNQWVPVTYKS